MTENQIATIVFNCGLKVHRNIGPGLLESVYEECLIHELSKHNLNVERQTTIPLVYEGVKLEFNLRADVRINEKIILELKSVKEIHPIHFAQTLTYLKMINIKLELLINFNEELFKTGFKRVINGIL